MGGLKQSIEAIEKHGILLVFPIKNHKLPLSLWSLLYPRSKMRWEWDEGADPRVAEHWHRREELSRCGKVVYAKWYQNRATFFSLSVFEDLLSVLSPWARRGSLSRPASRLLALLEGNSPQSTKMIKRALREQGIETADAEKAFKELWAQLSIVGYGEVDDGAFPSLSVGATSELFDVQWSRAERRASAEAIKTLEEFIPLGSPFRRYFDRVAPTTAPRPAPESSRKSITFTELTKLNR